METSSHKGNLFSLRLMMENGFHTIFTQLSCLVKLRFVPLFINIIRLVKCCKMGRAGRDITCIVNFKENFMEIPEGKWPVGRRFCRWK
jgi:hypothetical protein